MVHKPPEPEGSAQGWGLFMDHKSLSTVVYLLYSPLWLVCVIISKHTDSFHYKQGMLLVNMESSLQCKEGSYRKHHFITSGVYETESTESTTSCQIIPTCCHRNRGEVEYMYGKNPLLLVFFCFVIYLTHANVYGSQWEGSLVAACS